MRLLKAALRLTLIALPTVYCTRWAAIRLRRIMLRSTDDATPPIGPEQVEPRMRRVIVSDLHLGAGDRLDDFDADADLAAFIRSYVAGGAPTELIMAGDTFEFLQVRLPDLSDFEWSGAAAARRLDAILAGHPEPIAALRAFLDRPGNQLTLLIGNHDFELHYASAKQRLREALGLAEGDERLRFGLTYTGGGVYVDHGMQFDPWNRFAHVEGISEPFEVVRGTRMVKEVINPLEDDPLELAPLIDNVKPGSAFFWYMLSLPRLRQPQGRRFAARGLLRLARVNALPRSYGIWTPSAAGPAEGEARGRRRNQRIVAFARVLARHLQREPPDTALAEIQHEAKRQLRREMREFEDAIVNAMARIAKSPAHNDTYLFVCGHTHSAQVVALNPRQTYVNTGTWTTIVLDIATRRHEEQRFPFLEIQYLPDSAIPQGRLLVWQAGKAEPQPWRVVKELRRRVSEAQRKADLNRRDTEMPESFKRRRPGGTMQAS
jgi:UDP-2,3-diacylglucosamine pyrophosphatase LpxH